MGNLSFDEVNEFFNLPVLLKHQKDYSRTKARFPVGIGAAGSGKSIGAILRSFYLSIDTPYFGDLAGNHGLMGRQSRTDLVDTTMTDFLELINDNWIRKAPVKPSYKLELINGSIIQFVPMEDLGRFKSRNLGWAFFEEIDEIKENVFEEVSINRMRRKYTFFGRLITFHSCFGVCNPTKGWVYDTWGLNEEKLLSKYRKEQLGYNPDFLALHSSVYDNKANLPDDYIPNMELKFGGPNSKKGKMFLMGGWGGTDVDIYDWNEDLVNEKDYWPPLEWKTMLGLDHAWGSSGKIAVDFIALEPLKSGRTKLWVYDEIDLDGKHNSIADGVDAINEHLQFHAIKRAETSRQMLPPNRIKPQAVVFDPSMVAGVQRDNKDQKEMSIIDTYRQRCLERNFSLPFVPGNNKILVGTDRVQWLMSNKLICWNPRCIVGRRSHKNYVWASDAMDKPKKGQEDHHCDATRYLVMNLNMLVNFPTDPKQPSLVDKIMAKRAKARIMRLEEQGALI